MKIVLCTYGSRGDVQPLLALALALREAGHQTLLVGPPDFTSWAEGRGCPFRPVGTPLQSFLITQPEAHTVRAALAFARFLRGELKVQLARFPEIIQGADLVLGASLVMGLPTATEIVKVPYAFIAFCPGILPSSRHPFPIIREHFLPAWVNRLTWAATDRIDLFGLKSKLNGYRRRRGLKPVPNFWDHVLGRKVIVAADRVMAPVPEDVKPSCFQAGHFHLNQPGELPLEVEDFLAAGPAPVYVGFGSMPSAEPEALTELVIKAVRSAGHRIILSRGWAGLGSRLVDSDGLVVGDTPHHLLFPRTAAVVHHGGAGTTATAVRAGIPQIIIPQIMDQYYWGRRVWKNGLGPQPIWRSRLTAAKLTAAVDRSVWDEAMRVRTREWAEVLAEENDGVEAAVRYIESGFSERDMKAIRR